MKYYKCPGCGSVWSASDLYFSEGACLNYGSPFKDEECFWEDNLEEVTLNTASENEDRIK